MNQKIDEENNDEYAKYALDQYYKYKEEKEKADQKILDEIEKIVSVEMLELIRAVIAETGYAYDFKICDTPSGELFKNFLGDYDKDNKNIDVWLDQAVNGGYSGDEFSGTISIELPNKKYLQWSYDC